MDEGFTHPGGSADAVPAGKVIDPAHQVFLNRETYLSRIFAQNSLFWFFHIFTIAPFKDIESLYFVTCENL